MDFVIISIEYNIVSVVTCGMNMIFGVSRPRRAGGHGEGGGGLGDGGVHLILHCMLLRKCPLMHSAVTNSL